MNTLLHIYTIIILLLITSVKVSPIKSTKWKSIYQYITQEEEFSSFNDLVNKNRPIKSDLNYAALTAFVPENRAFENYNGYFESNLAFYHLSYEVKTLPQLKGSAFLQPIKEEYPPIWITKTDSEIYVNNARILQDRSKYLKLIGGDSPKFQILHVIDEILDPLLNRSETQPTAYDFLSGIKNWKIDPYSVSSFFNKIQEYKLQHIYKQNSQNTFFIPIDKSIDDFKLNNINKYTIYGHIINNKVLFTRPTKRNHFYESLANDDFIYSVVSFEEVNGKLFVRSSTVLGDGNNRKGDYYAEIIKANIPVQNGVVHLISKPLGISERILKPFPYISLMQKLATDPRLNTVYEMGEKSGFNRMLEDENKTYTYFVAEDRSWKKLFDDGYKLAEEDYKILGRHLIISDSSFSMSKLLSMSRTLNYSDFTLDSTNGPLKISVLKLDGEYYIKWHNKYIKVIRGDYECTNGILHVIDAPIAKIGRAHV